MLRGRDVGNSVPTSGKSVCQIPNGTVCNMWVFFGNCFIEIGFTYHMIHPFEVCSSMVFHIFKSCAAITTMNF